MATDLNKSMCRLTRDERIALIRVFYDLILADTVIDAGEMKCYSKLRETYRFSKDEEVSAKHMTFAKALDILRKSDEDVRNAVVKECDDMSVSDGFCARSEALLLMGIRYSLNDDKSEDATVISVPKHLFNIPDSCVVFIESGSYPEIGKSFATNYRQIFSEFRLAGFELIYIPKIINHYRESKPEVVKQIVSFISPELSEEGVAQSIEKLLTMTTAEFSKDILCNKLGMSMMRDTQPALLIKIGTSYVGDEVYANYLKLNLDKDFMHEMYDFIDTFSGMLSTDVLVISNNKEDANQFLYSGFYKLLLDTHLMRKNVRSCIKINPYDKEIFLADIDVRMSAGSLKGKALYMLMLLSINEGVNFSAPRNNREIEKYETRMKKIMEQYAKIYTLFGGMKAPDISDSRIRGPIICKIKNEIQRMGGTLYNASDYMILNDGHGNYKVHLDPDLVYIWSYKAKDYVKLTDYKLE